MSRGLTSLTASAGDGWVVLATFDAIANTEPLVPGALEGVLPRGWQMETNSHGAARRLRGSARFGVMIVTIAVAVLSILALAQEAERLFSGISHGLAI